MSDLEELLLLDAAAWRAWLAVRHADDGAVWLVLAKKGTTHPTSLSYDQALEEALCHGWIDGQIRRRDEVTYRQRFSRRRPRSVWSKRNVGIAERLREEGRMHTSGLSEIQRARDDGRWELAYEGQASIEIPEELATALLACPAAAEMFQTLSSQNRYAILYRVTTAKQAQTRTRRVERFVAMLARGETIYPQSGSAEKKG